VGLAARPYEPRLRPSRIHPQNRAGRRDTSENWQARDPALWPAREMRSLLSDDRESELGKSGNAKQGRSQTFTPRPGEAFRSIIDDSEGYIASSQIAGSGEPSGACSHDEYGWYFAMLPRQPTTPANRARCASLIPLRRYVANRASWPRRQFPTERRCLDQFRSSPEDLPLPRRACLRAKM
jgi:hypothetical protein